MADLTIKPITQLLFNMKSKYLFLLPFCAVMALFGGAKGASLPVSEESQTYGGNVVTEEGAWCWFADPRALHYENKKGTIKSSYIGYIDVHGAIKATQYDFLTGKRSEVLIRSYFQPDDHNNPTFLVLPDERVMIFYSRHTDEACFYYRVSRNPGDITSLGEEKKIVTSHNTTYPSPFLLSDDPEHIYLCWRGISWHPTIAKLSLPDSNDNVDFTWGPYQIVQSTAARPYAKYLSNGKDKIYLTYTTGHPDNENPNFVYFNFINIKTLQLEDVKGQVLSNIAEGAFNVEKSAHYVSTYPNTVVDNSSYRDWVWQIAKEEGGNPVIAMVRINAAKTSHDYYYAKWTGSEWKKTFLANGGGHFHQSPGLEMCYSGGMALDPEKPNEVYCSVPVTGAGGKVYEIMKYVVDEATGKVETISVTRNSLKNNVRPYILPGSGNSDLRLAWMHGDYYDWIVSSSRPKGYPTAIHCDFAFPEETIALDNGLLKSESFEGDVTGTAKTEKGVLVVSKETFATLSVPSASAFTISLSPYIYEGSYGGTLLRMGNLIYGVDPHSLKPFLTIEDVTYPSTNVLGTSDGWKTAPRGTGGQWYTPEKRKFFNLTFSYEGGVLTTYINGLIDQVIPVEGLVLSEVNLGGFQGWIEDCSVYDRVLNQSEILQLSKRSIAYVLDSSLLSAAELDALGVPQRIVTDVVLPVRTGSGTVIRWTSDRPDVVSPTGLVNLPAAEGEIEVTLTATSAGNSKVFQSRVVPRNIENNKMLAYEFETSDVYTRDGIRYVADKSGHRRDVAVYGNAKVDGVLDLSENTAAGFSTNGYAIVPDGVLDSLRSYTFFLKVKPTSLAGQPRLYDFGSASSNSVFGRGSKLTAGVKYNGEATKMLDSPTALTLGKETYLAFTFDAKSVITRIYMNGVETANGNVITREPYLLAAMGADKRNYIGRAQWWDTSEARNNIDYCGTIDDFYLFNIALTQEEILRLQSVLSSVQEISGEEVSFGCYPSLVPRYGKARLSREFTQEEMEGLKVEVFDVQGRLVQSFKPITNPVVIEGLGLSGLYVVRATCYDRKLGVGKLRVE